MSKLEKAIFWVGLVVIIIDNIYWQWWIKLTVDPVVGGDTFVGWSLIGDVVFLAMWVYVLIRIYKRASRQKREGDE